MIKITPEEKKQKVIEWGIAHSNERNALRRTQRTIQKENARQYNAIRRYMEATKTGNIHKLHDTIFMAFGLSPRTTKKRLDALEAAGVFQINGNTWKFLSSDNDSKKLLTCMETPEEEERDKFLRQIRIAIIKTIK